MNLSFLGGAMEIGASCIYLRIAGKGILMDSGIRQSAGKDPLPDFRTIQEQGGLDAVIVSHAHMDHIGTLPIISKEYPSARIYMTAMTADLARVLLYDSLKIMNGREEEIPHYSEQDVLAMLNRIFPVGYNTAFPMFDRFSLTFYPAGHIAGAACVYLTTEEGSVFYSGDFSTFSQRTIEVMRIPKLRPDVAIVETTYGNRLHANRQVEERRLVELVKESIREKKKILIPAFALGRAQEVLLILRSAIQNGEIPRVPVYVDGMVRDINRMYVRNPVYLKNALGKRILKGNEPFYTEEIQAVPVGQKREELLSGNEPVILLSSSGMLTGGPSAQYARMLAPQENACIIITGYQDEESPGRRLLDLLEDSDEKKLTIDGVTVPVRCRVEQVGLSAHGDKSEITALINRLSARRIFLVHGNADAMEGIAEELAAEDYRRQVFLPECGADYDIILHRKRKQEVFRLEKTMQMKRTFTKQDEKLLWEYWRTHYEGRLFSVAQIAVIWYGNTKAEEETLQAMQDIFLDSAYFAPDGRRLFLFGANNPETVEEALKPKELTMQELEGMVRECFPEGGYRKISYHTDRKEIVLQFDYPAAVDQEWFLECAEKFEEKSGWNMTLNPSMNHNEAALLLASLLDGCPGKTSYFPEGKRYTFQPAGEIDRLKQEEAAEEFFRITGWELVIGEKNKAVKKETAARMEAIPEKGSFCPARQTEQAEQNIAFSCIDVAFYEAPHKPEKKSLKQDENGKYVELSFISPEIGLRYEKILQEIADRTGWRLNIAEKINQNELMKIARMLCMEQDVRLLKNPSYIPEARTIRLKTGDESAESLLKIQEAFLERTGCRCEFVG